MKILGIHDGHNASVALLTDGKIEFALEEERLTRIKNHAAFPKEAISFLLKYTGTSPRDIDRFIFSSNHIPGYRKREELIQEYRQANSAGTYIRRALKQTPAFRYAVYRRIKSRRAMALAEGFADDRIFFQDHHLSHAAAAYYGCPWWRDESVLVLTNDGGGDGLCATVSIGERGKLRRIAEVPVSESIGYLYSMITFLLGMVPEEHEYKLMGMAPYAARDKSDLMAKRFAKLIAFNNEQKGMTWRRVDGCPHFQYSYKFLRDFIALSRFDIVCGGLQQFAEYFMATWVRNCILATGIKKVAMSGGVLMNVKANKSILEIAELEQLFVYPSCGDSTNSMGAAYQAYSNLCGQNGAANNIQTLKDVYWGPEYSDDEIRKVLVASGCLFEREPDIEKTTAELLTRGEIVARFKGRMEFGARAMGNRSILANPADHHVIRTINDMIKNRDFWMPFAPSLIVEEEDAALVNSKHMPASYMIMSFDSKMDHNRIFAASHPYDRTVRPQVVYYDWNPDYHRLISYFKEITGTGVILNTSFNLHGYPIVCSPDDAIDVLHNSGLKYLAIGNFLVRKN